MYVTHHIDDNHRYSSQTLAIGLTCRTLWENQHKGTKDALWNIGIWRMGRKPSTRCVTLGQPCNPSPMSCGSTPTSMTEWSASVSSTAHTCVINYVTKCVIHASFTIQRRNVFFVSNVHYERGCYYNPASRLVCGHDSTPAPQSTTCPRHHTRVSHAYLTSTRPQNRLQPEARKGGHHHSHEDMNNNSNLHDGTRRYQNPRPTFICRYDSTPPPHSTTCPRRHTS